MFYILFLFLRFLPRTLQRRWVLSFQTVRSIPSYLLRLSTTVSLPSPSSFQRFKSISLHKTLLKGSFLYICDQFISNYLRVYKSSYIWRVFLLVHLVKRLSFSPMCHPAPHRVVFAYVHLISGVRHHILQSQVIIGLIKNV